MHEEVGGSMRSRVIRKASCETEKKCKIVEVSLRPWHVIFYIITCQMLHHHVSDFTSIFSLILIICYMKIHTYSLLIFTRVLIVVEVTDKVQWFQSSNRISSLEQCHIIIIIVVVVNRCYWRQLVSLRTNLFAEVKHFSNRLLQIRQWVRCTGWWCCC